MGRICLLAVLAAALVVGCSERGAPEYVFSGASMGTTYNVRIVDPPPSFSPDTVRASVQDALDDIEGRMSNWLPDSEVSRFNSLAPGEWLPVSADTASLVTMAAAVSRLTDGVFDITAGPLVDLWGFGPADTRVVPPEDEEIAAAMDRVGFERVEVREEPPALRKRDPGVAIDLSAIAKGHAVDRVAAVLEQAGLADYLVEVGGELRVSGVNREGAAWKVAIEDPLAAGRAVQRVLRVTDSAIATSGDYRIFFDYGGKRYSHEIDARTGWPIDHALVSVTVLDPNAALADALATALLLLGPEPAAALAIRADIAAYFLVRDGESVTASWSPAFENSGVM